MLRLRLSLFAVSLVCVAPAFAAHHNFHADARAVIVNDGSDAAPVRGAASLAPGGGASTARVDGYSGDLVRVGHAESSVTGYVRDGVAYTVSTVTVTDVDIAGRIHADEIVARVANRHERTAAEGELSLDGTSIRNLTLDGKPVKFTIDGGRLVGTFAELRAAANVDTNVAALADAIVRFENGTNSIRLAGVGIVYFGEVAARFGERQLSMIRFVPTRRLRANDGDPDPNDGSVIIGSATANGTEMHPP